MSSCYTSVHQLQKAISWEWATRMKCALFTCPPSPPHPCKVAVHSNYMRERSNDTKQRQWFLKSLFDSELTDSTKASLFHNYSWLMLLREYKKKTAEKYIWWIMHVTANSSKKPQYPVLLQQLTRHNYLLPRMTSSYFEKACFYFDSRSCRLEQSIRVLNVWNGKDQLKARRL